MKIKIGDRLKSECIECNKEEIWEVESITQEVYPDGVFKTYHLKSIETCFPFEVRTSKKDIPEVMEEFVKIKCQS